jgi:hypothetical protein
VASNDSGTAPQRRAESGAAGAAQPAVASLACSRACFHGW